VSPDTLALALVAAILYARTYDARDAEATAMRRATDRAERPIAEAELRMTVKKRRSAS
jgi:hypothetical protein